MSNGQIFGYREEMWGEMHGELVHVRKRHVRTASDAAVPPGQSVEFEFDAATFPFNVLILDLDDRVGTTERRERAGRSATAAGRAAERASRASEHVGAIVATRRRPLDIIGVAGGLDPLLEPDPPLDAVIPFEITLTPPNRLEPLVFTNPRFSQIRTWPIETARIDPAYLQRGRGRWRISVKNINSAARRLEVHVTAVHALTPLGHQDIPLSLLNNLASVALQKALPTIEYVNGSIVVSTPTRFLDFLGVDRDYPLGSLAEKVVDGAPTFTPKSGRVMSRADFVALLGDRRSAIEREFATLLATLGDNHAAASVRARRDRAVAVCDESIRRLEQKAARDAAFCLVLEGMFANPEVDIRYVGTIAEIENQLPQIGLVFNEQFGFSDVISNLTIDLSPLLTKVAHSTAAVSLLTGPVVGLFALVGGITLYNSIDDVSLETAVQDGLRDMGSTIASYVKRAMERITDVGAIALHGTITSGSAADGSDSFHIQYFNPSSARPPRPWTPPGDDVGLEAEVLEIAAGSVRSRPIRAVTFVRRSTDRRSPHVARLTALRREAPGPMPADLDVADPHTLGRLDDHDCIAVIMMENRSYDHYFHDLPLVYPDKGYRTPPESYRNTAPPGFKEPFAVVRNTSVGIGNNLIFVPSGRSSDPSHNYEHTLFQIGGGTADTIGTGEMRGFAADFARKSDSPQIVMTYFGMEDLEVYKVLARHYPVCDRWFAALPVGTYPNRLASLQGNVPFLYNLHMDDPATGYLEDYSIFDLFNSQGITWKMFESDIATIRLYDRFRLDVTNVRPIAELDDTLRAAATGGPLPRAIFIEPQFLFGNDDHPPMDVRQGQAFIRQIVGKFLEHNVLHRTLFVITYDEHGGFFDHVAPPGTAAAAAPSAPDTAYGLVESLYPQDPAAAPKSLGVRVPSLVLSKWASARANHTVLDHTAILKTLLLHNRGKISTAQFSRFGERVKRRGHLGQVLDLNSPRPIDYAALAAELRDGTGGSASTMNAIVAARSLGMTPSHPASVLRGIAQPRARRIVERD